MSRVFDESILQRTRDVSVIMDVFTHPAIWDAIGGYEGFTPDMDDTHHYLVADGAVFLLHPEGDNWMIHANVIPEAREHAFAMAQEALRYGFEVLMADKIVAEIPEEYDNVYRFALKFMYEDEFISNTHKMLLRYDQWAQQARQTIRAKALPRKS